jgi:hypothetical protein
VHGHNCDQQQEEEAEEEEEEEEEDAHGYNCISERRKTSSNNPNLHAF